MKNNFVILFLFSIMCISCSAQKKIDLDIVLFLNEYREVKSNDYAVNGGLWGGDNVNVFRHEEFDAIASNITTNIFILQNECDVKSIRRDNEYEKQSGINDVYDIIGNEIIIGKIENNQAIYYKEHVIQRAPYLIAIQALKPLLLFDGMYTARYVLEKDIPALLERLKRTGEKF